MNTTSYVYFSSILSYLEKHQVEKNDALLAINFMEYNTLDPDTRINLEKYSALLDYASNKLQDRLFGFYLGKDIQTSDYGVLGYLVESCHNLAAAITALLKYDALVADIGKIDFVQKEQEASICWTPHINSSNQVVLRNMTGWVTIVRNLVSAELSPSSMSLAGEWLTCDLETLTHWFNCPIKNNAVVNRIDFPLEYLKLPLNCDNPYMHQAFELLSEQQLQQISQQSSIVQNIVKMMADKTNLQACTLQSIADEFNMSGRTLQRKLKAENTQFAQLLDAERKKRFILLYDEFSMGEIANHLGFIEQSSFNHAFQRWYGCSPKDYIKTKK